MRDPRILRLITRMSTRFGRNPTKLQRIVRYVHSVQTIVGIGEAVYALKKTKKMSNTRRNITRESRGSSLRNRSLL